MKLDTKQLIQGGAVGISIALIALIAWIIMQFMGLIGNHINSNTKAIQVNIKTQEELTGAIRNLTDFLRFQNDK